MNQYTSVIMICDPSKSYDCSSHILDFKIRRTRDIAPIPFYMQIYVVNISVIILTSKEVTKHAWGFTRIPSEGCVFSITVRANCTVLVLRVDILHFVFCWVISHRDIEGREGKAYPYTWNLPTAYATVWTQLEVYYILFSQVESLEIEAKTST
jgi:hypothetical protein